MVCKRVRLAAAAGVIVAITAAAAAAQWAVDDEPYGLLGCKVLRFRGLWEHSPDSLRPDEGTEGVCLAVAAGSVILYNKWPKRSHFDGSYVICGDSAVVKPVDHTWRFSLITGDKGRLQDCDSDDPELRTDTEDPDWTGIDEIRRLVYVVERAYGFDHECFRSAGGECGGTGYHPLEHIMKNRLGYPSARTVGARRPEARKQVIRSVRNGLPVIGMKCDHAYVIDGFKIDPKTGEHLYHSCDYVLGEGTMGWFTWKYLLSEGLERVIVGLSPAVILPKGPSTFTIRYRWGDEFVPATSNTKRRGYLSVTHRDGGALGALSVRVRATDRSAYTSETTRAILLVERSYEGATARIPATGTFEFSIGKKTDMLVNIRNRDPVAKAVRVEFHDFVAGEAAGERGGDAEPR